MASTIFTATLCAATILVFIFYFVGAALKEKDIILFILTSVLSISFGLLLTALIIYQL